MQQTERQKAEEAVRALNEEFERRVVERTAQVEAVNNELQKQRLDLQNFLDSMSTLNAKLAPDGSILLFNKIAQYASGLSPEELRTTNFLEGQWWAFDPEVQARVRDAFQRACSGTSINYDEKLFAFGRVLTINFSLIPVYRGQKLEYIVAEGRDITAFKAAEELLRASEKRFSTIFDLSPVAISITHAADERFLEVNKSFLNLLGFERQEVLGKTAVELGIIKESAAHKCIAAAILGQHSVPGLEIKVLTKSGEVRDMLSSLELVELGGERCVLTFANDITERKRSEKTLLQLNVRLEAANKELESFSHSVSHDLRAPLRHINGFAELLQKHTSSMLDEKGRRYVTTISDSAKRMGVLIDELLMFSRMGREAMKKSKVDFNRLVDEVLIEVSQETGGRAITFKIDPLPEIEGDRSMLRQAVLNLFSNAVKYTRDKSPAIITMGWTNGGDQAVFFVRDNGAGFDMKYANKLFGIFQRLHRNDEFEGTGIGLANVRRIIHRHGGRTWAEGKPNEGATFYFSLPRSTKG